MQCDIMNTTPSLFIYGQEPTHVGQVPIYHRDRSQSFNSCDSSPNSFYEDEMMMFNDIVDSLVEESKLIS